MHEFELESRAHGGRVFFYMRADFGPLLVWDPFLPRRSYVDLSFYSQCCEMELDFRILPTQHYVCVNCGRLTDYGVNGLTLINRGGAWQPRADCGEVLKNEAISGLGKLEGSLVGLDWMDRLLAVMDHAEAEYAFQPEGNARGAEPLDFTKAQELAERTKAHYRELFGVRP